MKPCAIAPKKAAIASKPKTSIHRFVFQRNFCPMRYKYTAPAAAIRAKMTSVTAVVCSVGISINAILAP